MSEIKRPRKSRRSFVGTIVPPGMVVLLLASCIGVGVTSTPRAESSTMPSVTPSAIMTTSPSPLPTKSPTASATPTKEPLTSRTIGQPSRIVYPGAGVDLPVAPLNQGDGPYVPPLNARMSYWLVNRPGYILAHSAQKEKWPFNALTERAKVGQIITLVTPKGNVRYKVTSVAFYPKHNLEKDGLTPVWDVDDKLLRLIGCKDGDVWQQVTVVTATIIQ